MASAEQLMSVGENCMGYSPFFEYFQSSIGAPNTKSCVNCTHFTDGKCDVNLFDKVLTDLDQG